MFARGDKAEAALAAGADKVGAEDLLEDMQAGNLDYGRVIATPDMMGIVGRLGKVLGPKGLMPNPKLGTVTRTLPMRSRQPRAARSNSASKRPASSTAASASSRSRTKRCAPTSTLSSMPIVKAKPSGAKGKYLSARSDLSSSMGPGLKIDVAEVHGG